MEPAESVKNLGVILDAENSLQRHVANLPSPGTTKGSQVLKS